MCLMVVLRISMYLMILGEIPIFMCPNFHISHDLGGNSDFHVAHGCLWNIHVIHDCFGNFHLGEI